MSVILPRRSVLVGLGVLAITPAIATARLSVPGGAFTLERSLARSLVDGKQIVVTRRWEIGFTRTDAGFLQVNGAQVAALVQAPPALDSLARIESARNESGVFPLLLDTDGQILGVQDDPLEPLPGSVADAALAYAKARSSAADAQSATRQFLGDLTSHGDKWLSRMPADLFFPHPRDRTITREIALPDGKTGTIAIVETASADADSGLLTSYRREASTTTGSTTRTGSETWRLTPAVS